jgi:uncharacterized protein
MENRIERLREFIDETLLRMEDVEERRCAYVHLYGVSEFCALIALKRNQNAELATIAGMLHDFYTYKTMDSIDHDKKGAELAKEVLNTLELTTEEETELICKAIYNHSNKMDKHSEFTEILVDADVIQHNLYNMTLPIMEKEKERYKRIKEEFGLR